MLGCGLAGCSAEVDGESSVDAPVADDVIDFADPASTTQALEEDVEVPDVEVLDAEVAEVEVVESAAASGCSRINFSVYPGSATSKLRYGRATFGFDSCYSTAPSSWLGFVVSFSENNTGRLLGFDITGVRINATTTTGSYRIWTGVINAKTCARPLGFPCQSYSMTAKFSFAKNTRTRTVDHAIGTRTAPIGMSLFLTP
jgi:hypothetical protein